MRTSVRLLLAIALATVPLSGVSWTGTEEPSVGFIVHGGPVGHVIKDVEREAGTVQRRLPLIGGVAARLPRSRVGALEARGLTVTPDRPVRFAQASTSTHSPNSNVFDREIGADTLSRSGIDGSGVNVALIDTGVHSGVPQIASKVVKVPDPVAPGETADCVNFSGEATCDDSYGHGTFVAGLIAGDGAYPGVARGAGIVSLKIAGRDGSADVSKVLAAIQWVTTYADDLDIGVLNLSLGTNSKVSYKEDPLNLAVERAWLQGVVVVASAGNFGPGPRTILKPADDPLVLTVAAVDDHGTPARDDDRLPRFSSRGPTAGLGPTGPDAVAKPDVVAPGANLISLRAPGSFVEERVGSRGVVDAAYRRGSGTSMSAAVTSGAVAMLRQARPDWSPDRIKFALMSTAREVASRDRLAVGSGLIQVPAATGAASGLANVGVQRSVGTGDLDGARGDFWVTDTCLPGEKLIDPNCDKLHGDVTAQGNHWDDEEYRDQDWSDPNSWYDSQWVGLFTDWQGSSWYGDDLVRNNWQGSSWYGDGDNEGYGLPIPGSGAYGAW